MTVKTRAQLNSDADTYLADNTSQDISPSDIRQRVKDLADSAIMDGDGLSTRVKTIVSTATPTVNTDDYDFVNITALATAVTSMTSGLTGSPSIGDVLVYQIKDNGTARAISWGASFSPKGVALPTTTVISKLLTVAFLWNGTNWGCVGLAQET